MYLVFLREKVFFLRFLLLSAYRDKYVNNSNNRFNNSNSFTTSNRAALSQATWAVLPRGCPPTPPACMDTSAWRARASWNGWRRSAASRPGRRLRRVHRSQTTTGRQLVVRVIWFAYTVY